MGIVTILMKDLRLELRNKDALATMIVFAIAVILLFAFAFDVSPAQLNSFAPGLLWLTYFFTAVLGLLRSFGRESDMEAFDLLLASPIDRASIYLGKMLAFFLFLVIAQIFSLPIFALFLDIPLLSVPLYLTIIILVTDLAIASVGILVAGMSLRSPTGATMLPILLFPLLTPVLIAATKSTGAALAGLGLAAWATWLMLEITYVVIFVLTGTFLFDYISEQ